MITWWLVAFAKQFDILLFILVKVLALLSTAEMHKAGKTVSPEAVCCVLCASHLTGFLLH